MCSIFSHKQTVNVLIIWLLSYFFCPMALSWLLSGWWFVHHAVRLETGVSRVLKGNEGSAEQRAHLDVQVLLGSRGYEVKRDLMASRDPQGHRYVDYPPMKQWWKCRASRSSFELPLASVVTVCTTLTDTHIHCVKPSATWLHLLGAFSPKAAIASARPVLEYSGLHVP